MKVQWQVKGRKEELERFRFDEPVLWHVVDHDMSEVRLSRDCAQDRKFRRGESNDVRALVMGFGTRSRIASSGDFGAGVERPR
jgi:hypothetical protein